MGREILKRIPEVGLDWLLGGRDFKLTASYSNHVDGAAGADAHAITKLALNCGAEAVLEIGTFRGHTTTVLAQNLPGARIYTIDLPASYNKEGDVGNLLKDDLHLIKIRNPGLEYLGKPGADRIVQLYGDTASYDFAGLDNVGFAFIDGSHTYAYCENDSRKCYEIMGARGALAWHDCDERHPGVLRLLNEWVNLGRRIVRIRDTALAYWDFKL
jgi:Methyltransferase domain